MPCIFQELDLEYGRYLKEVVQALESDPAFRKKLEDANAEDIKVMLGSYSTTRIKYIFLFIHLLIATEKCLSLQQ